MLVNANPTYISAAQAEENTCQEKEEPGADRLQHYVNVPEARRFLRAALKITQDRARRLAEMPKPTWPPLHTASCNLLFSIQHLGINNA